MVRETNVRTIIKTISWRILATLTTVSLVYIFIGDVSVALSVGAIEVFLKMLVYFIHERVWDKIKFGRREIKPAVIWLTGLAKSGKKEIGVELQKLLIKKGLKTEFIDGHSIRDLFPSTGFSRSEVNMHIERVGYLAKKLEDQGIFVIASFLSPYRESREFVKNLCSNFYEVHVSTPIEECEKRDETGIYKLARDNKIQHFPGIDTDYEISEDNLLSIDISNETASDAAQRIYNKIKKYI